MPDITVNIEIYCAECGAGLCNGTTASEKPNSRGYPYFDVAPCKKCLEAAKQEGYDEGYEAGKEAVQE